MKRIGQIVMITGMLFLAACFPSHQVPVDPLSGIVAWDQLPESRRNMKRFSQSSLGIILSDNVERQVKDYQDWGKGIENQKGRDNVNFTTGVNKLADTLRRNFRKLVVVNDLNECIGKKLDYCAVIDWDREISWGPSYRTSLQIFMLNSHAEKIAVIKGISDWSRNYSMDREGKGIENSEKDALAQLEKGLKEISPY